MGVLDRLAQCFSDYRNANAFATVYPDEAKVYASLPYANKTISRSTVEYVRGDLSLNGIESFWATIKRARTWASSTR